MSMCNPDRHLDGQTKQWMGMQADGQMDRYCQADIPMEGQTDRQLGWQVV